MCYKSNFYLQVDRRMEVYKGFVLADYQKDIAMDFKSAMVIYNGYCTCKFAMDIALAKVQGNCTRDCILVNLHQNIQQN